MFERARVFCACVRRERVVRRACGERRACRVQRYAYVYVRNEMQMILLRRDARGVRGACSVQRDADARVERIYERRYIVEKSRGEAVQVLASGARTVRMRRDGACYAK